MGVYSGIITLFSRETVTVEKWTLAQISEYAAEGHGIKSLEVTRVHD